MSRALPPTPARSPWQLLYQGAHALRQRWYRRRAQRLPRPVVSVGNLLWGGSGKTPLVAAIAAHLRDRSLAVTILSRGYGGRGHGVRVVSAGEGPLVGPLTAGDEPVLLAGELPGVAVVVGPDRVLAGHAALARLGRRTDLFLLDDGFSHLRLARDVDVVVLPADDPFGGGRLWPTGRLREPLAALRRADAVVVTGGTPEEATGVGSELARFGLHGPAFASDNVSAPLRSADGNPLAAGSRVLGVAGIARPERFFALLREAGCEVVGEIVFPDHHAYPEASLERIRELFAERRAEWLVTTGKDAVKLLGRHDLPMLTLPWRAAPEDRFWSWLDARLAALAGERSP